MKLIERVRETAKVLKTLSRKPRRQPPKRLQARVRAATTAAVDEYEDEEPQTKLTSAFVVVLILHLVAVGGIYAFNEIKASRKGVDVVRTEESAKSNKAAAASTQAVAPDASPSQPETVAQASITSLPANPQTQTPVKPRSYTVKAGDTLHGIAKANNMSVADLKAANNLTSDSIRQGQVLNLSANKVSAPVHVEPQPERVEMAEAKAPSKSYTVKSGDRLIFIAKRFNVTQEDLIAINKIKDPTKLQIGQTLKIPTKK